MFTALSFCLISVFCSFFASANSIWSVPDIDVVAYSEKNIFEAPPIYKFFAVFNFKSFIFLEFISRNEIFVTFPQQGIGEEVESSVSADDLRPRVISRLEGHPTGFPRQ